MKQKPDDSPQPASGNQLLQPAVPVFRCLIYLSRPPSGGVLAVVANLPGLEVTAENERAALSRIVPAFKQRMVEYRTEGQPIPWIEPPTPIRADQEQRVVPVHL
jgi:hypothetical protein